MPAAGKHAHVPSCVPLTCVACMKCRFQVFSALDRAQRRMGFHHADLGMRNVMEHYPVVSLSCTACTVLHYVNCMNCLCGVLQYCGWPGSLGLWGDSRRWQGNVQQLEGGHG